MFQYSYAPIFDDLRPTSRWRTCRVPLKRKLPFILTILAIAAMLCLSGLYFSGKKNSGSEMRASTTVCRKIQHCRECLENGCLWTNATKVRCRYDSSDFDRAVLVSCDRFFNERAVESYILDTQGRSGNVIEWNFILQILSYMLGIIFISVRFYTRRTFRRLSNMDHPGVLYRPLERIESGDTEDVEMISLV